MMTAAQYGNSGAYFANNFNDQTAFMLGTDSSPPGRRAVSAYSVLRQGGIPISVQARLNAPSTMIIGRLGHRPVAFPLRPDWSFNAAGT